MGGEAERSTGFRIASNIALIVASIAIMTWIATALDGQSAQSQTVMCYLLSGAAAGLVGYSELLSRYKDSPLRLFQTPATITYVLVNVAAGIVALDIIRILHVLQPAAHQPPDPALWLKQTLLASFGAIAFFRTSLFTIRISGSDVGIGPSAMLQALLNAADRMVDRDQAKTRAAAVKAVLANVDYQLARAPLPALCIVLMQNPEAADQDEMKRQIDALDRRQDIGDDSKMLLLGVYLIRIVGTSVLQRSVEALGTLIAKSGAPPVRQSEMAALMSTLDYAKAKTQLVDAVLKAVSDTKPEDEDAAKEQVQALDSRADMSADMKMVLLSAYLVRLVGFDKLKELIKAQGKAITK
ncbi:MAG TPA: hypothetical protein VGM17_02645 [Rhizomicrobium sp.]